MYGKSLLKFRKKKAVCSSENIDFLILSAVNLSCLEFEEKKRGLLHPLPLDNKTLLFNLFQRGTEHQ